MAKKISDFKPQRRNANRHTQRGLGMLDNSIAKSGWIGAITAAADGEVFDGSARLETSYTRFGSEVEPIIVETDGTRPVIVKRTDIANADDPKAVELAIAANRIAQVDLDFDPTILAEIGEEIDLSQFWNEEELSSLLQDEPAPIGEDDEEAVSDSMARADSGQMESRVKSGEIWRCGRHLVGCLDSTLPETYERLLQGKRPQIVWADPPYGISIVATNGYVGGGEAYDIPFGGVKNESAKQKQRRLGTVGGSKPFGSKDVRGTDCASNVVEVNKYAPIIGDDTIQTAVDSFNMAFSEFPEAVHCWWGGNYYSSALPNSSCWIVWDKENTGNFADAELAWCNDKSAVRIFRHMWNGMVKASEHGQRRVHPTQKPVALAEWFFDKYGNPSDLIIDPFLGSGMSLIAAEQMESDRTVYGCELSPEYCEVILQRWERVTGQEAELTNL